MIPNLLDDDFVYHVAAASYKVPPHPHVFPPILLIELFALHLQLVRVIFKAKVLTAVSKDAAGRPNFLKFLVVPDLKGKTIKKFVDGHFEAGAKIETDAWRSYRKTLEEKLLHEWQVFDADADMLQWLHIAISNAKAFIQGAYHGLDQKHLQRYLNEFDYRFNRRNMQRDIFDHLLAATVNVDHLSLAELKG